MMTRIHKKVRLFRAGLLASMLWGFSSAQVRASSNDFSDIAENITDSIEALPGLISGVSYLIGVLLATLGILKIKDHVENPTQTPLKDGTARVITGGALFGLPIIYESALNTIGTTTSLVDVAELSKVELGVR